MTNAVTDAVVPRIPTERHKMQARTAGSGLGYHVISYLMMSAVISLLHLVPLETVPTRLSENIPASVGHEQRSSIVEL